MLWNTWSSISLHSNNTVFMKRKHWQFTRPDWSHKPDVQHPQFTVQGTEEHPNSLMTPRMSSYLTKERGGGKRWRDSDPAVHAVRAFWLQQTPGTKSQSHKRAKLTNPLTAVPCESDKSSFSLMLPLWAVDKAADQKNRGNTERHRGRNEWLLCSGAKNPKSPAEECVCF